MEPLRIDNTGRKSRIHILHKQQTGRWNSILSLIFPDNQCIHLSCAHRHLERSRSGGTLHSEGFDSGGTARSGLSSLRHLTKFLHELERQNGSAENAMSVMERLGRETTGLLSALREHFTNAPATVGFFDYEFGNRSNLGDVDEWVRQHLIPLAEKRQRILTTDFDTRLATLPANPIFGLIIEHLRKRIYDSSPNSSLGLAVHLTNNHVYIDIMEEGYSLPPTPITDESTRLLWSQVVNLLKGTIVWRGSSDGSALTTAEHNHLRITYPLSDSTFFNKSLSSPARSSAPDTHCTAA